LLTFLDAEVDTSRYYRNHGARCGLSTQGYAQDVYCQNPKNLWTGWKLEKRFAPLMDKDTRQRAGRGMARCRAPNIESTELIYDRSKAKPEPQSHVQGDCVREAIITRPGTSENIAHCGHKAHVSLEREQSIDRHRDRLASGHREDTSEDSLNPRKHKAKKYCHADTRRNRRNKMFKEKSDEMLVDPCQFIKFTRHS